MTTDLHQTLQEREARYGNFYDHSVITQSFKTLFRDLYSETGRPKLAEDQQEALEMIFHKIGRILNGDPNYADSWHDIAGYAQLVADRLNGKKPMEVEKPMELEEMTREFRDAFDVKPDPLRDQSLIEEEYDEWQESEPGDHELKELADLVYVIFQYAASTNYNLGEALRRVHASNMTKIGPDGQIMRNEQGKVLKGPNYQPPNLEGCY